jgi:manganese/zinc/iron transport system permease protein
VSAALTISLVGSFVAASCALVGTFLVLRKMALLGDAISHAVLPGIVAAFLVTNSLSSFPVVIGASLVGLLTVFLVETLHRSRRLHEDTSIGVVFPALFSVGVILVSAYTGQVHIDTDCVLYGEIGLANLDTLVVGGRDLGPRAVWVTGLVLAADVALVALLYKELKIASFDPDLAASIGFSPLLLHYVLMGAVSATVVASFESVGSILVVAMLVVPPATAYLFTTRLSRMLLLAVGLGVASALCGYVFAHWVDCSISGAMAVVAGLFFLAGLVGSPRHGIVARFVTRRRLQERLTRQMLLLHLKGRAGLHPARRMGAPELMQRFGWSRGRVESALAALIAEGYVASESGLLALTPSGEASLEKEGTAVLAHPH